MRIFGLPGKIVSIKLRRSGYTKFKVQKPIDEVKNLVLDFIYHYQQSKEDMFHQMIEKENPASNKGNRVY
jgi:hypothetical protein